MGILIQQGLAASAGGGGWTLFDSDQLTSDGTTITLTGGSPYRHVRLVWLLGIGTAGADLTLRCRTSGGTFRDLGVLHNTGASAVTSSGICWITNFGTATALYKHLEAICEDNTTTLDNTDAINQFTASDANRQAWATYQEAWDEIEIAASTGNILGTTAGSRGYVYAFGQA